MSLCGGRLGLTIAFLAVGMTSACASGSSKFTAESDNVMVGAVQRPFRDLNLIREEAAEPLVKSAEAPYGEAGLASCASILAEIDQLNAVLGPDVDRIGEDGESDVVELATGAVEGLLDLPFRGVVRRATGAHERDEAIRRAVLAGMVRRGYLKGLADERNCHATTPRPEALGDPRTAVLDGA